MIPKVALKWAGLFTGLLFATSVVWDGKLLSDSGQDTAAKLLITSGLSGAISSGLFFAGMATGVAITLAVISFASYLVAEWIRRTELQLLLENCAYGIEHNFTADSGVKLLQLARAKSEHITSNRQSYLLRQPWVLSQLTNVEQGLMSASLRLYFQYKTRKDGGEQVIFESTFLDYITITFHLLNMPLIEGGAEVNILHLNKQGYYTILNFLFDDYQDNVIVNAEKGTVTVRFNISVGFVDRYKEYFTGGHIKVMIRSTHTTANGETIHTPANIHGKEQCVAFYFKYENTYSESQTRSEAGSFVSHSRKALSLENDRLFEECASTEAEIEPKWQE